jgi:adenine-specific DNA-methyltransferase
MKTYKRLPNNFSVDGFFKNHDSLLWNGDALKLLNKLPEKFFIDLVITSPPYNIGKSYEKHSTLDQYFANQKLIIEAIDLRVKNGGSICWQVGNHITKNGIYPLDYGFHEIFTKLGYTLKNRIVWKFGHGFHAQKRLSGRYEVILWYVKGDKYTFNLDDIRVPSKYPGKKFYKGPKKGMISSNPLGKNPEDVWEIPNVKGNHIEKTSHPCQFPIGLVERFVLGMSNKDDIVFDPFMGVASSGIAALLHGRKFIGADMVQEYINLAEKRINDLKNGKLKYRPHDKPLYDHKLSPLSKVDV